MVLILRVQHRVPGPLVDPDHGSRLLELPYAPSVVWLYNSSKDESRKSQTSTITLRLNQPFVWIISAPVGHASAANNLHSVIIGLLLRSRMNWVHVASREATVLASRNLQHAFNN
jgi:hypothetical protein